MYVKDSKFYVDYLGKQYELNSFVKTYKREGQTVASQIKFYAFLTFGRNYVCSKTIKRCFPLSVLLHYILSDTTDDLK